MISFSYALQEETGEKKYTGKHFVQDTADQRRLTATKIHVSKSCERMVPCARLQWPDSAQIFESPPTDDGQTADEQARTLKRKRTISWSGAISVFPFTVFNIDLPCILQLRGAAWPGLETWQPMSVGLFRRDLHVGLLFCPTIIRQCAVIPRSNMQRTFFSSQAQVFYVHTVNAFWYSRQSGNFSVRYARALCRDFHLWFTRLTFDCLLTWLQHVSVVWRLAFWLSQTVVRFWLSCAWYGFLPSCIMSFRYSHKRLIALYRFCLACPWYGLCPFVSYME